MEQMRVAVCDDDEAALGIISNSLKQIFERHGIAANVQLFSSAIELSEAMARRAHFDFLLLDIDMPGLDGITFAKALREQGSQVDIMYISSREDLVFDSLRVSPVGFVRKSRFLEDMSEVVSAYLDERAKRHEVASLVLKDAGLMRPVRISTIEYVESRRKDQLLHLIGGGTLVVHSSMRELEEELTPAGFIRVHQGYLVNYRQISLIADQDVQLTSGESLPVSRRKLTAVRAQYLALVQENNLIF